MPPRRRSSEKIRLNESNDNVIDNSKENFVCIVCLYFDLVDYCYGFVLNWFKVARLDCFAFIFFIIIIIVIRFACFIIISCFAFARVQCIERERSTSTTTNKCERSYTKIQPDSI